MRRAGASILCIAGALAAVVAGAAIPVSARSAPTACAPITITEGGRYVGCYRSTDVDVPAVTVGTAQRVVLAGARIEHAGEGIAGAEENTRVVVRDSTLVALDPGTPDPVSQRAVTLFRPASFTATHNRFAKGHGVWIAGDDRVVEPLRITFNRSVDVGRYGHPERPNCCVQFVQLDHVRAAADIGWNRTSNAAGRSSIEDNLNLYGTSGLSADEPLVVHHNLISGAYPATGDGDDYTGGGIMVADSGGDHLTVRRNRVVSTTNYGVAIVGGNDNHLVRNRLVNDGRTEAGALNGPEYGVGIALWDPDETGEMARVDAHHNVVGWRRGTDLTRNDTWLPACEPVNACTHNRSLAGPISASTEQAERRAWVRDLAAAGHTVGPR